MRVLYRSKLTFSLLMAGALALGSASAAPKYDKGANDQEVVIGQTFALSGPVAVEAYQTKVHDGYFRQLNEQGGINGRKIRLITLDDGYSPPRTMEQTRRLVERDQVLFIAMPFGSPTNAATQRYLNGRKVPQINVLSGASRFFDGEGAPWTTAVLPAYVNEGAVYGQYLQQLAADPASSLQNPKIGILYQNDDFGKDYVQGLKQALGDRAKEWIVHEASYEPTDPTLDSQIIALQNSGANVFMNFSAGRATLLSIRKAHEIGWKPLQILDSPWATIDEVLKPAGLEASTGIISSMYLKEPGDSRWADDPGMQEFLTFMQKYVPDVNPNSRNAALAYLNAALVAQIIKQAGDDLTRANIMKQATSLSDVRNPMLLPGVTASVSETKRSPIDQLQIVQFDGSKWVPKSGIIQP
ncbi:MAG: ABC transporter substrate-binding protein [Pigmentiphaga sp.]